MNTTLNLDFKLFSYKVCLALQIKQLKMIDDSVQLPLPKQNTLRQKQRHLPSRKDKSYR